MPEVLSLTQLAERYGLSPAWVKRQAKAGRLPYLKAGARLLFNSTAVAEALARMAAAYPGAGSAGAGEEVSLAK